MMSQSGKMVSLLVIVLIVSSVLLATTTDANRSESSRKRSLCNTFGGCGWEDNQNGQRAFREPQPNMMNLVARCRALDRYLAQQQVARRAFSRAFQQTG